MAKGPDTFELGGRQWPRVTWWNMKGMRGTYMTLWAALITSATNGYDGSLMNGLEAMDSWVKTYNNPDAAILGLLVSIMYIGGVLAIPLVPWIADTYGRRIGIVIGCLVMLFGVALVSIGGHVALFVIGRLILGFGLGIAQSCSPLLLTELVHPQHRPQYSTIYNALWYVGSVIGSCVVLGTEKLSGDWAWRVPCLLQAIPSLSQLIFIWIIPESPRWLISKGRFEEAKKILADVHAQGDLDDELINVEFEEIQQTIGLEKEYEKSSWTELFKTPGNRHRVIILISIGFISQWSGNGLISYYLPKVLDLIGVVGTTPQLRLNMYLQIVNVLSAVGIGFFVDYFGRVPLFRTSIVAMTGCFVAMTIGLARYMAAENTGGNTNAANAFIVFMFFYYIAYNIGFSGMLVSYSVEILPYRMRAKGIQLMFLSVDLSLFFNSYVNAPAIEAITWKYYVIYCCWLVIEALVVFKYYVETKGRPLEEIAKVFDGDAALIGGGAATEKAKQLAGDEEHHVQVEIVGKDEQ